MEANKSEEKVVDQFHWWPGASVPHQTCWQTIEAENNKYLKLSLFQKMLKNPEHTSLSCFPPFTAACRGGQGRCVTCNTADLCKNRSFGIFWVSLESWPGHLKIMWFRWKVKNRSAFNSTFVFKYKASLVSLCVRVHVYVRAAGPASQRRSRELCWELHGAQFFKMSSLEQRLSRIEEKLKQENEEARRRIDLNIDMSPQRSRPRPSECLSGRTGVSVTGQNSCGKDRSGGGREGLGLIWCS